MRFRRNIASYVGAAFGLALIILAVIHGATTGSLASAYPYVMLGVIVAVAGWAINLIVHSLTKKNG